MTTKFLRFVLGLLLATVSVPAVAANACYTPEQMQAEQLLRLHSELMVVTVTCHESSRGQDLGAAYGDFTKRNIRVLHDAEQTMIGYYKAHKKGDPTEHLDRLRTILANEYGQKSADMSPPVFCTDYRDEVVKMETATPADVENEVQRMVIAERSFAPLCHGGPVLAKNKYK
ncbi:MAG: hypothetical protein P4M15_05510 [Alphaproteobacteria bacterium]|nr:hypothetical protein [Alphaproteobacteria bacterium]